MTSPKAVEIYDTTLRDGSQREGISYTLDDKLRIAKRLDEFGVAFIVSPHCCSKRESPTDTSTAQGAPSRTPRKATNTLRLLRCQSIFACRY